MNREFEKLATAIVKHIADDIYAAADFSCGCEPRYCHCERDREVIRRIAEGTEEMNTGTIQRLIREEFEKKFGELQQVNARLMKQRDGARNKLAQVHKGRQRRRAQERMRGHEVDDFK